MNAGGGDDPIVGSHGLAGLISSSLRGQDGSDRITGTDGADDLTGGAGSDIIRSRDKAADRVDCGKGLDLAIVDRRDRVRNCNIVLGGRARVKLAGTSANVADGAAALRMRCVATQRCSVTVKLLRNGKTLGTKSLKIGGNASKSVSVKLNQRGRRLVRRGSSRVQVRIDAHDAQGNGWRTTGRIKLAG